MNAHQRLNLFKLLSVPYGAAVTPYIPDSLGFFSPFIDPWHDHFGRDFVTCFLIDVEGKVAVFNNTRELNYVPYNILFHPEAYNRCLPLLFPDDEEGEWPFTAGADECYHKWENLRAFALGDLSAEKLVSLLRKGRFFEGVEMLLRRVSVYRLLCFDKELLQERFKVWKEFKKEFRAKGVYVFEPHPARGELVKLSSPRTECDERIAALARTIGQTVPILFRDVSTIDADSLRNWWVSETVFKVLTE